MSLPALYRRVLESLGSDKRLAWALALANVALVLAQFAEPVLFGRIIDRLTAASASPSRAALWDATWPYLLAWIAFGFFTIVCGALIALHADRLAHRRRQIVLQQYFEHVLQLPLSHHAEVHSGRLMKIMLQGTDSMWALWLGFFREHLAAFLPSTRRIRWATWRWCKALRGSTTRCARSAESVAGCSAPSFPR